jgi:hypothetical protein
MLHLLGKLFGSFSIVHRIEWINSLVTYEDMSGDGPYKCVSCNGREFKSREELEKHNEEQHSTSTL